MLCFLFSVFEVLASLVMSKHGTADWQCIIKGQWREKSSTFSFVRGHWLCHADWRGRLVNHAALIHHNHTQYTPLSNSDTKRPSFSYPEKTCNPQECNLNKHKRMRWRTDFSFQSYLQNIFLNMPCKWEILTSKHTHRGWSMSVTVGNDINHSEYSFSLAKLSKALHHLLNQPVHTLGSQLIGSKSLFCMVWQRVFYQTGWHT